MGRIVVCITAMNALVRDVCTDTLSTSLSPRHLSYFGGGYGVYFFCETAPS